MAEEDSHMILCVRCSDLPQPAVDSTMTQCSICGAAVWIAPSSLAFMSEEPDLELKVGCNQCFQVIMRTKATDAWSEPMIFTSVPGAHVDIARFVDEWMGGLT